MAEQGSLLHSFLNIPAISRVRRNHGLEHATLHILSQRFLGISLAGHSNTKGFWLLGEVSTEAIQEAVEEALRRLRAGERRLAVHPNCGTNFVTAGALAGVTGALAMSGAGKRWHEKLDRLALAASLATLMLIVSQPLALLLQAHITTSGEPGDLQVVEILCVQRGRVTAHRIITRG
jgi:hypothetical protein